MQRHTLYAHFPDADSLFRACTNHWRSANPFPEATSDPRHGLRALYDWHAAAGAARLAAALPRTRGVRARIAHAVEFETWRSLVRRQGLSHTQAVDAMVDLIRAADRR